MKLNYFYKYNNHTIPNATYTYIVRSLDTFHACLNEEIKK